MATILTMNNSRRPCKGVEFGIGIKRGREDGIGKRNSKMKKALSRK
jgi:hypothetical protein